MGLAADVDGDEVDEAWAGGARDGVDVAAVEGDGVATNVFCKVHGEAVGADFKAN